MTATRQQQDVIDVLLDQHVAIKQLFTDLASADGPRKRELFEDLVRLLAVHESAEEQVVHPVARAVAGDGEVEARLHEEEEAKHALSKLYDLGVDHPAFDTELTALSRAVLTHAEHEEREEFARLRREESPEKLRRLAGALTAAEKVAPTRPHPGAGQSATANMLLGPPMGVFDRVRDAIRDWRSQDERS